MQAAKNLVKSIFRLSGFEVRRASLRSFNIAGLRYEVDPFSVGQTPQGELTAKAAVRLIRERGMRDLRVMDVCCGAGIIGLTMWSMLRDSPSVLRDVGFVDINIFNLNSLRRTLEINGLENQFRFWLSDALKHLPVEEKFDLIVSNPPHFFTDQFTKGSLSADRLGSFDEGWKFHEGFYRNCHQHLTVNGEVWFLENGRAAKDVDLLPFIKANRQLVYVETRPEPTVPHFFWMISRRAP